mmetsp:Transcript_3270/g.6759  ORF Transcript_3270/g.6759 Transcript_3270/m.6759 type:complete len:193 (-) Transcript_3270:1516-2094(-)
METRQKMKFVTDLPPAANCDTRSSRFYSTSNVGTGASTAAVHSIQAKLPKILCNALEMKLHHSSPTCKHSFQFVTKKHQISSAKIIRNTPLAVGVATRRAVFVLSSVVHVIAFSLSSTNSTTTVPPVGTREKRFGATIGPAAFPDGATQRRPMSEITASNVTIQPGEYTPTLSTKRVARAGAVPPAIAWARL